MGPRDQDQASLQCSVIRFKVRVDEFVLLDGGQSVHSFLYNAAHSPPLNSLVLAQVLGHVRIGMLEVIVDVVLSIVAQVV